MQHLFGHLLFSKRVSQLLAFLAIQLFELEDLSSSFIDVLWFHADLVLPFHNQNWLADSVKHITNGLLVQFMQTAADKVGLCLSQLQVINGQQHS